MFIYMKAGVLIPDAELAKMYMKQNTQVEHGVQAVHLHMIRGNLTFTSGKFKGKSYTRNELRLKYDSKNNVLYVFDKFYA